MGRCNNARTRAAAESLRNAPARARFSQPPPGRGAGRRSATGSRPNTGNAAPSSRPRNAASDSSQGHHHKLIPAHLVVAAQQKLLSKQQQQQQQQQQQLETNHHHNNSTRTTSSTSSSTGSLLVPTTTAATTPPHTAKSSSLPPPPHDCDLISLSPDLQDQIFQLLRDCQVVVDHHHDDDNNNDDKNDSNSKSHSDKPKYDDDKDHSFRSPLRPPRSHDTWVGGTYVEQENDYDSQDDDVDEDDHYHVHCSHHHLTDTVEHNINNNDDDHNHATALASPQISGSLDPSDAHATRHDNNNLQQQQQQQLYSKQDEPIYQHLTQHLTFSSATAMRACVEAAAPVTMTASDRLSNVMDWLCLHLSEAELEEGFRPQNTRHRRDGVNPGMSTTTATTTTTSTTKKYKAIPHPSISIIGPRTTTTTAFPKPKPDDWSRQAAMEDRAIAFLKFGFQHEEIVTALQQQPQLHGSSNHGHQRIDPIDDTATLLALLQSLEEKTVGPIHSTMSLSYNDADLEETEQECEVLRAIYEDQFSMVESTFGTTATTMKRCQITIDGTDLTHPSGVLYTFFRPGYPGSRPPLFLWVNHDTIPWPLVRRINQELIRCSTNEVGRPIVFEIVSQLVDFYPSVWEDYQNEQRNKECEEVLCHDVGTEVAIEKGNSDEELRMEDLTAAEIKNLSRRQKSKLVQAQKSHDKRLKDAKLEEQRLTKQEQHQERVKYENQYLRQTMADRAILKREQDRLNEGIRKVSRLAMSQSLNNGNSLEDARVAARQAERDYRNEHGMDLPNDDGDGDDRVTMETNDNKLETSRPPEVAATIAIPQATPTTRAFIERLRQFYSNAAAQGKVSLSDLAEPVAGDGIPRNDDPIKCNLPRPIAVPVGDIGTILNHHVLTMQQEQPWLVAGEARAPLAVATVASKQVQIPNDNSQNLSKRQIEISDTMKAAHDKSQKYPSKAVRYIRQQTRALPAFQMRHEIVSTVKQNQVTLISASTGAGKTTVIPTLLLNDMIENGLGCYANIWVTQPRRISAISVAERIASERGEKVGETCGYSIKLERKCSSRTRITLCTTGILLRRLQCDPDLANMSHLIIDEVHERDINSDFALIILKDLLQRRKTLKLILMSATFEKGIFASYFNDCAVVEIPGRAHPVQEFRLEDVLEITGYEVQEGSDYALKDRPDSTVQKWSKTALKKLYHPKYSNKTIHSLSIADESKINYELVAALLEHLTIHSEDGAILVFMPGMAEISNTIDELRKKEVFQSDKVKIYPLHSSLSTSEQSQVFQVPPAGIRKIVVATNIAETSITVSDVVYVVDSGRVKENRRDEIKEAPALVDCWVSTASAQQRRGRAGRVRPGVAYHLFSSHTHDNILQPFQQCEMSRVGIEDLVLQVLILDLGDPCSVLARAITPPSAVAMRNSLKFLEELGAIECQWQSHFDETGTCVSLVESKTELTPLGFHLATLPVDPRIGKVIIYGALFGCIGPALTIAAAMSSKSPFISSFDNRDTVDRARESLSVHGSDHLTILNAFDKWKTARISKGDRAASTFARDNYLNWHALIQLDEIRNQLSALLRDIGFLSSTGHFAGEKTVPMPLDDAANVNSTNMGLVTAVLCAGMYPNILVAPRALTVANGRDKKQAGEVAFQRRKQGDVYLHPSVLSFSSKRLPSRYCCYHEIIQTKKLYVRDMTVVSPFALLLFGGTLQVYHTDGIITVDTWLKFRISRIAATLIKYLRSEMETMLLQKIVSPSQSLTGIPHTKAIVDAICALFLQESGSNVTT